MTCEIKEFYPTAPEGVIPLAFDFADFLGDATISSVKSVTITTFRGTDASPETRLHNAASIDGKRVIQWVKNTAVGATYKIKAVIVASDGREWPCTALLPVCES